MSLGRPIIASSSSYEEVSSSVVLLFRAEAPQTGFEFRHIALTLSIT
jgi:hypothetical protein